MNAYEVLKERGFIEQLTHEEEIKALFEKGGVTFYIGIDPTALEPMGFTLQSGSWPTNTPASEKSNKLQVLVGASAGYNFEDSRKSYNSPKRYRWQGQTDANGNELPPFVDVDKDKMTLTITNGDDINPKTQTWELEKSEAKRS